MKLTDEEIAEKAKMLIKQSEEGDWQFDAIDFLHELVENVEMHPAKPREHTKAPVCPYCSHVDDMPRGHEDPVYDVCSKCRGIYTITTTKTYTTTKDEP